MPSTERISRHFIGAVPDEWQLYSDNASDYTIGAPIGFGASSIVYQAEFRPSDAQGPVPCALKVLDLDRLPQHPLRLLQRETQLMSLSKHPNVLRVRGTWMTGHKLYIALRLMNAGSAADVMHYGWPGGMEEEVVRCVLKQALEGLNYLHINGFIHRDVKAANLLIDDDGTVLLGDLGVAAFLGDNDDTTAQKPSSSSSTTPHPRPGGVIGKRKSFVGTPCWMAPEVINRKQYDASADIWSFGITALELAQGRAPRSREPPHSVLLHIVTNVPPTLDREAGPHKYSRAFQELIERCLNKDPSKRPTAEELLQTPFLKGAKKKGYLVGSILKGLPPLAQRQERRKQASIISRTLDSWDFSPTTGPPSPTMSILSPPGSRTRHPFDLTLSERLTVLEGEARGGHHEDGDASEGGERAAGAAMDAGHESARAHRITAQHAPRPHSAAPSRDGPGEERRNSSSHSHSRSQYSHHSHSRSRGVSWVDDDEGVVGGADFEEKAEEEEKGPEVMEEEKSHAAEKEKEIEKLQRDSAPLSPPTSTPAQDIHHNQREPRKDHRDPGPDVTPKAGHARPVPVPKTPSSHAPNNEPNGSPSPSSGTTPPTKLWRRLIGRPEEGSEGGGESIRKRVFSGVLGVKRTTSGISSSPSSD